MTAGIEYVADLLDENGAVLSICGRYRYRLWRSIAADYRPPRTVAFVMLNPSTADATTDDPTIRRCRAFADRERATSLEVVNLFAWRATDPAALAAADDPVGPHNDLTLRWTLERADLVVAAWGAARIAQPRARTLVDETRPPAVQLHALGVTAAGAPRHPLYVRGDAPLVPYPQPAAARA